MHVLYVMFSICLARCCARASIAGWKALLRLSVLPVRECMCGCKQCLIGVHVASWLSRLRICCDVQSATE